MPAIELSTGGWTAALGGSLLMHAALALAVVPFLDSAEVRRAVTEITFSEPEVQSLPAQAPRASLERTLPSPQAETLDSAGASTALPASGGTALPSARTQDAATGSGAVERAQAAASVEAVQAGQASAQPPLAAAGQAAIPTPPALRAANSSGERLEPPSAASLPRLAVAGPAPAAGRPASVEPRQDSPQASVAAADPVRPAAPSAISADGGERLTPTGAGIAVLPAETGTSGAMAAAPATIEASGEKLFPTIPVAGSTEPAGRAGSSGSVSPLRVDGLGQTVSVAESVAPVLPMPAAQGDTRPTIAAAPAVGLGLEPVGAGETRAAVPATAAYLPPVVTARRPPVVVMRDVPSPSVAVNGGEAPGRSLAPGGANAMPAVRSGAAAVASNLQPVGGAAASVATTPLASVATAPPAAGSARSVTAGVASPLSPLAPTVPGATAGTGGAAVAVLAPQAPAGGGGGSGSGRGSAAWRQAVDFVRDFGGDGCFAALPVESGERVGLQAFSADGREMQRFASASARTLVRPTAVERSTLARIQCSALRLARSSKLYPDFSLSIALDAPDGEEGITGQITGAGTRAVHLLLIDETGEVQTVRRFPEGPDEPLPFDFPFSREELAEARGLFLAVASDKRMSNLDLDIAMQAPEFFELLERESKKAGAALDIAMTAFDPGDPVGQ